MRGKTSKSFSDENVLQFFSFTLLLFAVGRSAKKKISVDMLLHGNVKLNLVPLARYWIAWHKFTVSSSSSYLFIFTQLAKDSCASQTQKTRYTGDRGRCQEKKILRAFFMEVERRKLAIIVMMR